MVLLSGMRRGSGLGVALLWMLVLSSCSPITAWTYVSREARWSRRQGVVNMVRKDLSKIQRVVVTGVGPVSAVGTGKEAFWNNLLAGHTGIDRIQGFDPSAFTSQIGAEIKDFNAALYFNDKKSAVRNDRYTTLGVAGARLAVDDAGLDIKAVDPERFGVIVGTAFGGMATMETQIRELAANGPGRVSPLTVPALLGNTISGIIAIELGAQGPNFAVLSACAAATHALGVAYNTIATGEADVMISGGSEAAVTPFGYASFCSMKAMATKYNDNPTKGSRPFDKDRCGFVMGEGAGMLVLESLEHAQKRNARIYGEFVGYGASCDAFHITMPHNEGRGLASALKVALEDAGLPKEDLTYINAHGTSTPYNDKFETLAIKKALGEERAKKVHISSTKGATGHTLGAAGGLEAIVSLLAVETGTIPPTLNYENPDPDCDLNYTPNKAVQMPVKAAASSSLGFGGHNGVVIFRKFES